MNKEIIKSERFGEQYSLIHHPSGLDILIWKMENYSTTEAAFATRYGSINTCFKTSETGDFIEVPEGIAHYLEHKLFESEDIPVFELYAQTGASANAFTFFDETAYTFSTSKNWERSLEILLDYVQKPYFTQENVDKERGIIAQEIKMYEDSPSNACFYNMLKAIYKEHPVKIDIAGTVESIAQITPELLYDCYNTFYNLHNMVLSIAGNVDEDKVIEICDRILKPAKDLHLECKFPEEGRGVAKKRVTASFPVGLPLFDIGFKSKACDGMEFERKISVARMALKMLIGSSSPLYQQLFDEGLINSQLGYSAFSCSGSFFVCMVSGESRDPDEVYRRLLAEIERVRKEGFDEESFNIVRKSRYGSIVRMFGSVEGLTDAMTVSYFNGTSVFDEAELLADITAEDCRAALDELFDEENSAISIIEPIKE
ncbi:MAG: insulinase family protein [Ruminococcus sp.]|uniref:EF-P 5-aminopentanol modification-associated protein YfmH n=1 Tax=Ruminococcus sp. TaxID=41978 RepID=UPI0025FC2C73|nr:pitrilysin family protein [Ruminococcus sp.]MCR5540550.1 insulinase family protein [Ruminococcus sp.]